MIVENEPIRLVEFLKSVSDIPWVVLLLYQKHHVFWNLSKEVGLLGMSVRGFDLRVSGESAQPGERGRASSFCGVATSAINSAIIRKREAETAGSR